MKDQCTKQEFLAVVSGHSIEIIRDDETHRHISFSNNGSFNGKFDLITWPGSLCISGDYGTYVFARTTDMFTFFRGDRINPGYWGAKLQGVDKINGYREFSVAEFNSRIIEIWDAYLGGDVPNESQLKTWEYIDQQLFRVDWEGDDRAAYAAVMGFGHFNFDDFLDGGGTEVYTYHYLWNLYAIVWGIRKYDAHQEKRTSAPNGWRACGTQESDQDCQDSQVGNARRQQ